MKEGDSSLKAIVAFFALCAVVYAFASGRIPAFWLSSSSTQQVVVAPTQASPLQPQSRPKLKPQPKACEGGEIKGGFCVLK